MKGFLDEYMQFRRDISGPMASGLASQFREMCTFIVDQIGPTTAFRPDRAFNAAAFDAISVTVTKLLNESRINDSFSDNYWKLIKDETFVELTSRSTADPERVRKRFETADAFIRG